MSSSGYRDALPAPVADEHEQTSSVQDEPPGVPSVARSAAIGGEKPPRRLVAQLEHLRTCARTISQELDTRQLAETIAEQGSALLSCKQAIVGLVADGDLQLLVTRGHTASQPLDSAIETLLRSVVRDRQARFADLNRTYHSGLGVPILNHQSRVLGGLVFSGCIRRGFFQPADLRVAECLADMAAMAFDRSRIFDRMQAWTNSLETLLAFNAAVNQQLSPAELLRKLVQNAVQFLKSSGGMAGLAVLKDDGQCVMRSPAYFHDGHWVEQSREWPPHDGTPGTVLVSEFPIVANHYAAHPLCDARLRSQFGVYKSLSVPVKNAVGKVLGFFEIHRGGDGEAFTWQDAAFLESLGNTAAVAIENAQLLDSLASKQRQIEALSAANVLRLEKERLHISRELHDETGQMLIGMQLSLQMLTRLIPSELADAHQEIDQLRTNVRRSAMQLRDLSKRLRPPTLDELGFDLALQQLVADFESHGATRISVVADQRLPRLPADVATALYRIAQEALTNVFRHAAAKEAWLRLSYDGVFVRFVIEDNGRGFDIQQPERGLGLLGMQERVAMLGGRFRVRSNGQGTSVHIKVPIDG